MFALVDVNSFYASCERVFRPDLEGKPIVVVSNNDGCIISLSREAKQFGIKMGEPYFKFKEKRYPSRVYVFSSNYALYADLSSRVMQTLTDLAPAIEIYSIDEAFVNVSGVSHCLSLETFGHQMRTQVFKNTGLTVGVGIAPTKTLAKLANYAAKRWASTGGVVDLSGRERQRKLLEKVPVEEVWGVGRRITKKLNAMGITTALELAEASSWVIRKHFNVVMERTARELRGEPCLDLEEFTPTKQQIICSRSFGHRITQYEEMHQAICAYAERAAEKLRGEHQYCRFISVFVRTSPHADNEIYYGNQASVTLMTPTNDSRDIIRAATEALGRIWLDGYRYMKAGVMLADFFSSGVAQLNLFDDNRLRANSAALMEMIDSVNHSGKGKIWFAGQGIEKSWAMKREMLSPAYTTRYADLPVAK
ncbi:MULTISPECIES: translesion error-prone DNA polymerase V subunit UmuC [Enterobacter]|jgi:DNA polymerase V|uniref:translesion error-prone DNA polymerase V subunit UmuC n=1 Tax=Enterobacter TaxID=547 RepID=UPI000237D4A4|nr:MULTISPECIES: translesion error-prone DNA polymerase V subunit UmuC [Enterobacter]MDU2782389.1 translesion error-prone DNA polymerase V subunit UmuC [Enterobacter sp.]KAA1061434.1 translesion error-prone DNA polymerase V subunit UmuC [Enterobacter mori]MBT1882138.1 translesion error-prone DNA polymerase V subunit UmuC [Enterobacter mori]MBT2103235.1 translesion error-prone DNA polymerase V subunit UmuC [Enterobacter mori]MCO7363304.1 translesion error-prone DNA polymerase V subunit UmuC [En